MTIGVFTIMLRSGGTERVIAQLSRIWTALGHNVVFFTREPPHENEFPHACTAREYITGEYWKATDADKLQNKHALDLVVFNGGWNNSWVSPVLCRFKELHVRTLAILHHSFNNWAFSGCNAGDFDKERLLAHLDCLVCVDKMQALWWSHRHSCVAYMPNPVSFVPPLDSRRKMADVTNHSIVWVGRADDIGKRVNLAIEVFREVRKKVSDATMTVVGSLPKGWKCNEPGITCTGYVPNSQAYVQSASVQLLTTQWEVTVPQVVLEAKVVGVPTVAFDLPVLRGEKGVFLGKDISALADLIISVFAKPDTFSVIDGKRLPEERNEDARKRWEGLFAAWESGGLNSYIAEKSREYKNLDEYARLVDEIQRSEMFIVATQIPILNKFRRWQARWDHLKKIVGR